MASLTRALILVFCTALVTSAAQQDPALTVLPIPDRTDDIVSQLRTRDAQVGELIDKGNFAAVYVPAFQAKDLAIALEARLDSLAPPRRDVAAPAIREVVRLAWLLDTAGDLGNRQALVDAHKAFSASVAQVIAAF